MGAMRDLASAFYFSAVTYTTTGYGDLVLPEEWRLVGGVEALTGILMCGHRPGADGSAILAGRRGNDAHRHRVARDQQRPLGVVRRRAHADGLLDFRPDAYLLPPGAR